MVSAEAEDSVVSLSSAVSNAAICSVANSKFAAAVACCHRDCRETAISSAAISAPIVMAAARERRGEAGVGDGVEGSEVISGRLLT